MDTGIVFIIIATIIGMGFAIKEKDISLRDIGIASVAGIACVSVEFSISLLSCITDDWRCRTVAEILFAKSDGKMLSAVSLYIGYMFLSYALILLIKKILER